MPTKDDPLISRALATALSRRAAFSAICVGGTAILSAFQPTATAARRRRRRSWRFSTVFGTPGTRRRDFDLPAAIYVPADDTTTVWVADTGNNRISVWSRPDADSTAWLDVTHFGSLGSGDSNFSNPVSVALSADTRTAWVADLSNHRVVIWTRPDPDSRAWQYTAQFGGEGSGDGNFLMPTGVSLAPDELTLWVADAMNHRISVWTRPAVTSTEWSPVARFGSNGTGGSNFNYPTRVVVSADTLTAWVSDSLNSRISIWSRQDAQSTTWTPLSRFGRSGSGPSQLRFPADIKVSADTLTAWVVDQENHRIAIWTRADASATEWSPHAHLGSKGRGEQGFGMLTSIALSADEKIMWLADSERSRISVWTAAAAPAR